MKGYDVMKKIFISQPMNGKSKEEILAARNNMIAKASEKLGDEMEVIDSYFKDYDPKNGCIPLKYLSKSLELLADADMLILGDNWEAARGCRIEFISAISYDIPAYQFDSKGELVTARQNPMVKLKDKEPICLIADLHMSPDECYIIHGSHKSCDDVTRFTEDDVEFIIM